MDFAAQIVMKTLVRIPRLMKVVRSLRKERSNTDLAAECIKLAETLYANDLGAWVSQTIQDNTIPTASPDLADLLPESLTFNSYQEFEILNRS